MKDFAKIVYKRKHWKKCRAAYIKHRVRIDGGLCEMCHDNLGYIVHHKVELTVQNVNDPSVCYGFFNLQYVCLDCHNKHHGYFAGNNSNRMQFDDNGDPIPPTLQEQGGGSRGPT